MGEMVFQIRGLLLVVLLVGFFITAHYSKKRGVQQGIYDAIMNLNLVILNWNEYAVEENVAGSIVRVEHNPPDGVDFLRAQDVKVVIREGFDVFTFQMVEQACTKRTAVDQWTVQRAYTFKRT